LRILKEISYADVDWIHTASVMDLQTAARQVLLYMARQIFINYARTVKFSQ